MIDPRYSESAIEWADMTTPAILRFGQIPKLMREEDWPNWAFLIVQLQPLEARRLPDPRTYTDWREWAIRFNQAVF
jgi:hypothetical protein